MEEASHNQSIPEKKKSGGSGPILAIIAILVVLGLGLAMVSGKKGPTTSSPTPAAADADGDKDGDKMMAATEVPRASATAELFETL